VARRCLLAILLVLVLAACDIPENNNGKTLNGIQYSGQPLPYQAQSPASP
jgi:hypothetical protein